MSMYPSGKGMFVWQIKNVLGGNPQVIADRAVALGLSWVAIKLAGGTGSYNLRWSGLRWVDDIVGPLVDALRAVGVQVYGWHYMYLRDGKREAEKAIERIEKFDLDGWLMDPEAEAKGQGVEAWKFGQRLADEYWDNELKGMRIPVGLCSYRYPTLHWELPWDALVSVATFHCPQVYWQGAHNPAYQLERSYNELMAIKALPFVPAGSAYDEHGWIPLTRELDEFDAKAKSMGLPGLIWWEWAEAIANNFENTIAGHDWGVVPDPDPEPDPEEGELEDRVKALEDRVEALGDVTIGLAGQFVGCMNGISVLQTRMAALVDAVSGLNERVEALEAAPVLDPDPDTDPETMVVTVTASKLRVETICGYDAACAGFTPPGKPVIQPDGDVIRYDEGDTIIVRAGGQVFSCKDNPNTAIIVASGGGEYYRIAAGPGVEARFSEIYPVGGYVDASKVGVG